MTLYKLICYGILTLCLSCQTIPKPLDSFSLPIPLERQFSSCTTGQGALSVTVFEGEEFSGAVEVEWKDSRVKPLGWQSQFLTPIGQELLRFSYLESTKNFRATGRLAPQFSGVSVSNGFLEVDDHFVGLRADEISCFLDFKLPRKWLSRLVELHDNKDKLVLSFHEKNREIRLVYSKIKGSDICTDVSWSNYWGLVSSTLSMCFSKEADTRSATVHGIGDYKIKWKDIDE